MIIYIVVKNMFNTSYASLEEVYNPILLKKQQNKYNKIVSDISSFNKRSGRKDYSMTTRYEPKKESFTNNIAKIDNVDNMNLDDLEKMIDSYSKPGKKVIPSSRLSCDNFLEHIKTCKSCRAYVMEKFSISPEKTESEKNREEMLDIAIYILTGVFVLFLLDTFLNLGKFLKK